MMKNRGIDALVNDCLIGPVLTMVSWSSDIILCSVVDLLFLSYIMLRSKSILEVSADF